MNHVSSRGEGLRVTDALDHDTAKREAAMMGLRLNRGLDRKDWREKFGNELSDFLTPQKITRLSNEGYLNATPDYVQATTAGLQRLNALLNYLLN